MTFSFARPFQIAAAIWLLISPGAIAQQLREVSIGLGSASLVTAPARLAAEIGLFAKHGLTPRFVVMDSASAATTALISRSVPVVVSGTAEVIVANARGQNVVMLSGSYMGLGGTLVISKAAAAKAGVAATAPMQQRLKALDGLVIAAPSPTATYKISIDGPAKAAGATIRFTYMAMTAMPAAMDSGAIQGFIASAPIWGQPVLSGSGVAWISGPKGELPSDFTPTTSSNVQTMRDFAEGNADLIRALSNVFADFAKALDERPAEVKAAIAKLYPDITGPALDLVFASESAAWRTRPLTAADVEHEIAFVKSTGAQLPDIDKLAPASLLLR